MSTKRTSETTEVKRRRVLVTRSAEQAPALAEALRELGLDPVCIPTIEIVPPDSYVQLDQAIAELDRIDYLLLTSTNAIDAFFNRLGYKGVKELPEQLITVAVGPKSAAALDAHGVKADLVPVDYRAEGVVALLKEKVAGKKLLYPKAGLARDLIPTELGEAGAEVIDPVAYSSAPPSEAVAKLKTATEKGLDLLTFTASSTVDNFVALLSEADFAKIKPVPVASIGPLTTATATKHGFTVVVEPASSTLEDLVEAIKNYFETRP